MRILTVADFFYPGVTGGASIVIYEVMRRLVERNHQVIVLTRQQEGTPEHLSVEGIEIWGYPVPDQEILYPIAVRRCLRCISRLMERYRFDIVNAHHAFSGCAAELFRLGFRTLPSVFYFHGPWHKEAIAKDTILHEGNQDVGQRLPLKYRLRRRVDRFVIARCTAVVGLSDYMFREAEAVCPEVVSKFHKIPGGVDTERFRPVDDKKQVRRQLGLPEEKTILLTVRRLSPRMGLENLVKAMAIVERLRDDVMLIIGGKGELQDRLRRLIAELGLRHTRLVGYIDDGDLPKYYQASDLFIMPSLTLEGFGLSTLEALACGVPVLGTPTGGTPEILREVLPDFILPGMEPEDIANGILGKIPDLRNSRLQTQTRRFAEGFSWARIAGSLEALFQELVCRG